MRAARPLAAGLAGAWLALLLPVDAAAVDGVVEINDAKVTAGGVTPGDAPGYPATLTQPGSYRLTGTLAPPAAGTAIEVEANDVAIDLNGFSLHCEVGGAACALNSGYGVDAVGQSGVTVRNGFVRGFGTAGVAVGERGRVEDVDASFNTGEGISASGSGCSVSGVIAWGNGSNGIRTLGCGVTESVAAVNGGSGFRLLRGSVARSAASSNSGYGIYLAEGTIDSCMATGSGLDGILLGRGTVVSSVSQYNDGYGLRGPTMAHTGECPAYAAYGRDVFDWNQGGPGTQDQVVGCAVQIDLTLCASSTVCP